MKVPTCHITPDQCGMTVSLETTLWAGVFLYSEDILDVFDFGTTIPYNESKNYCCRNEKFPLLRKLWKSGASQYKSWVTIFIDQF